MNLKFAFLSLIFFLIPTRMLATQRHTDEDLAASQALLFLSQATPAREESNSEEIEKDTQEDVILADSLLSSPPQKLKGPNQTPTSPTTELSNNASAPTQVAISAPPLRQPLPGIDLPPVAPSSPVAAPLPVPPFSMPSMNSDDVDQQNEQTDDNEDDYLENAKGHDDEEKVAEEDHDYDYDAMITADENLDENEKNQYKCTECGKKLSSKRSLEDHSRIHTGEKPFPCTQCKKKFRYKTNLDIHIRTHTGTKPYACKICRKRFAQKGHLTSHEPVHSNAKPFSCDTCGKSFASLSYLKKHMVTHSDEKTYKCSACEYTTKTSSCLAQHKIRHAEKKPYTCDICGYSGTTSSHLTAHKASKKHADNARKAREENLQKKRRLLN